MTQTEARDAVHKLQQHGVQVIADTLGGWSGSPRAQQWGVRFIGSGAPNHWLIGPTDDEWRPKLARLLRRH